MNKKIRTEAVDHLFQAILSLKDAEECYKFFEDVCTINELLSLSQRYEVAKMLREGKTYLEIAEKTGASTATISRVNRSLNYGSDGYDMVFSRLESEIPQRSGQTISNKIRQSMQLVCSAGFFVLFPHHIKHNRRKHADPLVQRPFRPDQTPWCAGRRPWRSWCAYTRPGRRGPGRAP